MNLEIVNNGQIEAARSYDNGNGVKVFIDEQERLIVLEYKIANYVYKYKHTSALALGQKLLSLNLINQPDQLMLVAFELQQAEIALQAKTGKVLLEQVTYGYQKPDGLTQLDEPQLRVANILKKEYGYLHSDAVEVLQTYLPSVKSLNQHWTPEDVADMLHASWINDQNLVRG